MTIDPDRVSGPGRAIPNTPDGAAAAKPASGTVPVPQAGVEAKPREADGAAFLVPAMPAASPITERGPAIVATPASRPASAATAQVIPAMLSVVSGAANSVLTLHLNPGELGSIRVTLEQNVAGNAGVTLTVERPETMQLLRGDLSHLHAALDMAGVAQAGRTLSLHMQAPEIVSPPTAGGLAQGSATLGSPGTSGGDTESRGNHRQANGAPHQGSGRQGGAASEVASSDGPARASWSRAGIDITA